jgi:hypothetical protein
MKTGTLALAFIFVLFGGCARAPSTTAVFEHYLNETFGLSFANEDHYYLVIPNYGCIGCIEIAFEELIRHLPEPPGKFTWIVSADQQKYLSRLTGYNVLIDKNNDIGHVALNIANLTTIHTLKGEVKEINNLGSKEDAERFLSGNSLSR